MVIGAINSFAGLLTRQVSSFSRTFGAPPAQAERSEWGERAARFALLWSFWDGTAYEELQLWAGYKNDHGLSDDLRLFRSHVKRLVDFWFFHVYAGELAEDGLKLPGGIPNAIPLADDTDPALAAAIGQLWQWWGWVDGMRTSVLYAAVTGNCLVEIVDDIRAAKIRADIVWPGYLADVQVSASNDLVSYIKAYPVTETKPDGSVENYLFAREVTKAQIVTYKNGEPHNFDGFGAERANPYGFVPAVLYRHSVVGGTWGEPAMHGSQAQLDLMNSLYSMMYGNLAMLLDAPIGVSGSMPPGDIARQINAAQAAQDDVDPSAFIFPPSYAPPSQIDAQSAYPEIARHNRVPVKNFRLLQLSPDAKTVNFSIDMAQVRETIRDLNEAMEAAFPEIRFWDMIREMTTITKPGVESALGDVLMRYRATASGYDRQTKKLSQMGVAIGGMRMNDGTWRAFAQSGGFKLTQAHDRFKPFNLDSYGAGKLNFSIMPRDLVAETKEERLAIATSEQSLNMPEPVIWQTAGRTEEEIAEWVERGWIPPLDDVEQPGPGGATTEIEQALSDLDQLDAELGAPGAGPTPAS